MKPNQTSSNSQDLVNNSEVSYEVTTTAHLAPSGTPIVEESENSTTSKPGPVVLPPYFLVPNRNSTIGEQFTPQLPPTVFDKPIGGKAPFIPILPPSMETTIKITATIASPTLAPPISAAPSRSLTPVEYGSIGTGCVLLFALFAYIYQKYKQYRTSSSGGSYSPKAHHRSTAGGKRGSKDSGGGQSLDVEEAKETITSPPNTNDIITEVTVVDIVSEIKTTEEVIEIPVTKTVVNGLQKSSTNDIQPPQLISGNFHETISETQNPAMEKPPRKTRTPTNFTSDKTSASHLNSDSLITVSHAIGGILRSQVPDNEETEDQVESNGESCEEGISLLGRLVEPSTTENVSEDADSDEATFEETLTTNDAPVTNASNEAGLLCTSVEVEMDAGSEYFSADENSDIKNSPPASPSLKQKFKTRILRAEDVYNTEIITEDGRRRSIEEDIADSIDNKSDGNLLETTLVAPTNNSIISTKDTEHDNSRDDYDDLRREIYIQNLINAEKSNSQNYRDAEAEAIVDDILRASQLDSLTIQSIRKDLGSSETKPRVRWSDNIQSCAVIDSTENEDLVSSTGTDNKINTDEGKDLNIKNQVPVPHRAIDNDELKVSEASTQNMNTMANNSLTEKNVEQTGLETQKIQDADSVNSASKHQPGVDHSDESKRQDSIDRTENTDTIDEGFPAEHRFEFIPPKQPQIFEDDMIVFSNSDQESISTISNSTAGSNGQNEEQHSGDNKKELEIQDISATSNICEECGGIQAGDLVAETSNGLESINSGGDAIENPTKWYVPNDEITDVDLINGEEKLVEGLYIDLSESTASKLAGPGSLPPIHPSTPSSRANKEIRNFSHKSYAYIEVNDDPKNEGWPGHLPKNIHPISGVGLFKTADVGSASCDVLKEEDISTSDSRGVNIEEYEQTTSGVGLSGSTKGANHLKPIPKFIIPNMDARLSKKRFSRRRQIKSLDSGVHHYYGEYLDLVEFPESEIEGGKEHIEKETEEVIIIKPDGTITEEKIVIENTH